MDVQTLCMHTNNFTLYTVSIQQNQTRLPLTSPLSSIFRTLGAINVQTPFPIERESFALPSLIANLPDEIVVPKRHFDFETKLIPLAALMEGTNALISLDVSPRISSLLREVYESWSCAFINRE